MVPAVAQFFNIMQIDMMPPQTLAELIPWLATIFIGVALVCGVFGVIGMLAKVILSFCGWNR